MVGDRISALPDEVLHNILSSLSTKEAVATSVLAKKWRYLWHSVSNFDFDFNFDGDTSLNGSQEAYLRFARSVYNVLTSGDLHRPIHTFRLRCSSRLSDANDFNTWINIAVQRRFEHLDLSLNSLHLPCPGVITIPSCMTLVCLKLEHLWLKDPSSIEFPSLKILHLNRVTFSERTHLVELLLGSPVIEDLNVTDSDFIDVLNEKPYKSLIKLVKAYINSFDISFETVKYAQFLPVDWAHDFDDEQQEANPYIKELIPIFPNLTHLEFIDESITTYWPGLVVEMLNHSPKLRFLSIDKGDDGPYEDLDWQCPPSVPESISSQLRTCCLNKYVGSEGEFQLASYILENATRLQSMTICCAPYVEELTKLKMLKKLSMCTRQSSSCKLSFT